MHLPINRTVLIAIAIVVVLFGSIFAYYFVSQKPITVLNGSSTGSYVGNLTQLNSGNASKIRLYSNSTVRQDTASIGYFNSSVKFFGFNVFSNPSNSSYDFFNCLVDFDFNGAFSPPLHPTSVEAMAVAYNGNSVYRNVSMQISGIYWNQSSINNVANETGIGGKTVGSGELNGIFNLMNRGSVNSTGYYRFSMGAPNSGSGTTLFLSIENSAMRNNLTIEFKLIVNGLSKPIYNEFTIFLVDT